MQACTIHDPDVVEVYNPTIFAVCIHALAQSDACSICVGYPIMFCDMKHIQ